MPNTSTSIKILHITTHLGGGVGTTLLAYFKEEKSRREFSHSVFCLGYMMPNVIKKLLELNVPFYSDASETHAYILSVIPNYDIVVIHMWNHPLMYDFLVRNKLPPCRVIMLAHNSGFHPPNIYPRKTLTYPDLFVFSTPLSFKTKDVQNLLKTEEKSFFVVWSSGDPERFKNFKLKKHDRFNIGYIGTVDYAKLHIDFLTMCDKVDIPDAKFIVVGGLKEKEIQAQAKELGIEDKFIFTGVVTDINKYLETFDVFGYPLTPDHYGTCDLTLQESMLAGVVPVVLNNPMESYIVDDGETGIVAKNKRKYIEGIELLYKDVDLRNKLSKEARKESLRRFSLKIFAGEWKRTFDEVLTFSKTSKKWDIDKETITHADIFLESLGRHGKQFVSSYNATKFRKWKKAIKKIKELGKENSWQTETKGSVYNYNSYFPNDPHLSLWSRIMRSVKNAQ